MFKDGASSKGNPLSQLTGTKNSSARQHQQAIKPTAIKPRTSFRVASQRKSSTAAISTSTTKSGRSSVLVIKKISAPVTHTRRGTPSATATAAATSIKKTAASKSNIKPSQQQQQQLYTKSRVNLRTLKAATPLSGTTVKARAVSSKKDSLQIKRATSLTKVGKTKVNQKTVATVRTVKTSSKTAKSEPQKQRSTIRSVKNPAVEKTQKLVKRASLVTAKRTSVSKQRALRTATATTTTVVPTRAGAASSRMAALPHKNSVGTRSKTTKTVTKPSSITVSVKTRAATKKSNATPGSSGVLANRRIAAPKTTPPTKPAIKSTRQSPRKLSSTQRQPKAAMKTLRSAGVTKETSKVVHQRTLHAATQRRTATSANLRVKMTPKELEFINLLPTSILVPLKKALAVYVGAGITTRSMESAREDSLAGLRMAISRLDKNAHVTSANEKASDSSSKITKEAPRPKQPQSKFSVKDTTTLSENVKPPETRARRNSALKASQKIAVLSHGNKQPKELIEKAVNTDSPVPRAQLPRVAIQGTQQSSLQNKQPQHVQREQGQQHAAEQALMELEYEEVVPVPQNTPQNAIIAPLRSAAQRTVGSRLAPSSTPEEDISSLSRKKRRLEGAIPGSPRRAEADTVKPAINDTLDSVAKLSIFNSPRKQEAKIYPELIPEPSPARHENVRHDVDPADFTPLGLSSSMAFAPDSILFPFQPQASEEGISEENAIVQRKRKRAHRHVKKSRGVPRKNASAENAVAGSDSAAQNITMMTPDGFGSVGLQTSTFESGLEVTEGEHETAQMTQRKLVNYRKKRKRGE